MNGGSAASPQAGAEQHLIKVAEQPQLTLDVPLKTSGARPELRGAVSSSAGLPKGKISVETGGCQDLGPAKQWMKKRVESGFNNFANAVIAGLTQKSGCLCVALSDGESKGLQQRRFKRNQTSATYSS